MNWAYAGSRFVFAVLFAVLTLSPVAGAPPPSSVADSAYPHVPLDEATDPDLDAATDERISSSVVTIHWQMRDIEDALHDLEIQCHRADPHKPIIRFRLDWGPAGVYRDPKHPIRRSITYSFDKFSVRRLLAYIAMITDTGFAMHQNEIIFVPDSSNSPEIASKIRLKFPTLFVGPRADQEQ